MRCFIRYVLSLCSISLLIVLAGCQNSTGQLFSPTSDIHVAAVSPSVLQPTVESSGGDSSSSVPTFPLMQVHFRVTNGVSVFLDQYTVHYYTPNGVSLANGRYDVAGALSAFIQAPEINSFEDQSSSSGSGGSSGSGSSGSSGSSSSSGASIRAQSTGGGEQQTIPSDVAGYTTIDIYSEAIYTYMTRGNADASDDITPIIARITIHGRDLNDKEVSMLAQTTLTSTILTSSSN